MSWVSCKLEDELRKLDELNDQLCKLDELEDELDELLKDES